MSILGGIPHVSAFRCQTWRERVMQKQQSFVRVRQRKHVRLQDPDLCSWIRLTAVQKSTGNVIRKCMRCWSLTRGDALAAVSTCIISRWWPVRRHRCFTRPTGLTSPARALVSMKHAAAMQLRPSATISNLIPDTHTETSFYLYRPSQNRRKACRTVPKMEQNLQKAVPSVTKSVIFLPDALRLPAIDLLFPISRQWPRKPEWSCFELPRTPASDWRIINEYELVLVLCRSYNMHIDTTFLPS